MIDINFDFQAEAKGRDSDRYSPTLQEYHRLLWSKKLPSGEMFSLTKISNNRLHHKSPLGEFYLSSDRAIPTFSKWKRTKELMSNLPKENVDYFIGLADTIGGILIWPSNKINNMPTINAERGFNSKIADRLDLTIECIRLYYNGQNSPLYETFNRYADFFNLFEDFKGYVDFFLLQDAVFDNYSKVKISTPFDQFKSSPIPKNKEQYLEYLEVTSAFINERNKRIAIMNTI